MKKLLLFVIACTLGLFGTVSAQETITIGEGSITSTNTPFDIYNGCGICQQLFLADEIGHTDGGIITSVAIKFMGETLGSDFSNPTGNSFTRKMEVYVNNVELSSLGQDDGLNLTSAPNFNGTITLVQGEWAEFVFDTPFEYEGGNILITIYDYTDDYTDYYLHFSADYLYGRTLYANITSPLADGYLSTSLNGLLNTGYYRNQIQLTFAAAGEGGETPEPEQPGEDLVSTFEFNFNDGSMEGWRAFQGEGNGEENKSANWQVTADGDTYYAGYEETKGIYSYSWNIDENVYNYPYNYVVTTQAYSITSASELSWYMRYTYTGGAENDKYQVVASTNGVDFDIVVWEGTAAGANENTISLAEYAGQTLYLGFYHYTIDQPGDAIVLDNIVIKANEAEEGGETPEPTPVAPTAPVVEATVTETTVTLTWAAVENATYYNIYTPSGFAENILGLEETTYTFEGLTAGTEYCFEVSAGNDVDESDTTEACATTTEAEIEEPTVDLTKQYRVKATSLDKYLYVMDNDAHATGPQGGVVVYQAMDDDAQLFTLEDAGDGAYYFKSATGYYIYCQAWNVDAYSTTEKTALKMVDQGDGTFRLQNTNNNKYFKVQQVGMFYFPFCDCDGVDCTIETWTLEAVEGGEEPEPTPDPEPEGDMCVINITLTDSYGDGWNGNILKVEYGTTSKEFTLSNGNTGFETMEIPQGSHVTVTYNKIGSYPDENSFVVSYESGEEILNIAKGSLSSTVSYEFDIDCTPKAPATPIAKVEATGGSTIALTWNVVPTATSYNVYEGTEVVATVTETSYNFAELTPDTQYCYAVSAINEVGESEISETVCATTFAEGTVIVSVGEGGIESFSAPIYNIGSTVYSLSQQIYTSDEIGFNGGYANIQSISFHKVTGDNNVRNIVVYLQNVDKEMFAGNYDWIPFTDADIVYQGEFDFGVAGDWVTINFPTEFEYKGGNLAVTVYDKTGVGYGYDYAKCDKFTSSQIDNFRGMYVTKQAEMDFSQLSTYYGTTMKTTSYENPANVYYINSAKFRTTLIEADPIAPAPTNVVATANGYSLITLTWDAVETANKYNVYAGTEKIATVTEPTYTLAGLEAETEYCFTVTSVNSGGESEASEEKCATTTEFNGCYVNFTLTDQPNDGWDGCSLVVEYDGLTESFNCPGGTSPKTYTIAISQGSTAKVTYKKGSNWPQEKGIIVTYESGKEILNIAQGSLTETTSWEFVVDCTPEAPGIATATAKVTGDETIELTMSAVGAESFNIYLGEELVATTTENVYTVEGLQPETEYCFTVEAVNEVGTSEELSEVACATTYKVGTAVVQIGEGTDNIVSTSPVHEFFANSISQTVYTAEEIGFGAGSIKSIAYNKYSGGNNDRNIAIYMKNVNVEDVDFTKDWEALTEDLCVYDGYYNFGTTGWVEIALQEAFDYTGGDLLVCVLDKTGAYANIQDNFYTYVTGSLRSIYYGYSQTIDPYNINLSKQGLYNNNYNTVSPQVKFVIEPVGPVAPTFADYRLESVAKTWGATEYVYDEEMANTVVAVVEDGVSTEISYNEAGQIASAIVYAEEVDSIGNPIEYSSVRYTYNEDGVWVGYKEITQGWMGRVEETNATLNYNENGQLVSVVTDELIQEVTYNEAGLIAEVLASKAVVEDGEEEGEGGFDDGGVVPVSEEENEEDAEEGTEEETVMYTDKKVFEYDEEGRLVKKSTYFYYGEFVLGEVEVYEYDENGNCVSMETYEADEETGELREYPWAIKEYFYDLTINNEDVYSFDYPHFAFINWVEPSHVNILTKVMTYNQYFDEEIGELVGNSYDVTAYNYNPEVLSAPLAPMNVQAEVTSAESIELSWAGFADAETFTIYSADTVYAEGLVDPYYTIEGLEMNVDYCFTVQAVNAVGVSEVSAPACAKIELPAAPANLVATATSDTTIALTWEEVPGIWEYNVYKVVEAEGETTYEFVGQAWWINYTVEGLEAETEYSFVVKSSNNIGESVASNVATAKTLEAPKAPAAPVVEAEATSDTTIVLTWATVEGALSYNVYQGEDSIANVTDTTYTVTGLTADTEYTFTVTAINEVGESEASNEAKAKTNAAPVVPTVPAAPVVEVVEVTETTIVLTWATVEGALSYNVYQGEDSIANVTDTTYTVTGLTANTEYCFTVTAVNEVGESAASEEVCATTKPDAIAENAAAFNIYPNPVADRLFIETEANVEEVTIYTLTGVMIYSEVDFNNNSINVSELNGGVYIMKVRTENGEAVRRFIKK